MKLCVFLVYRIKKQVFTALTPFTNINKWLYRAIFKLSNRLTLELITVNKFKNIIKTLQKPIDKYKFDVL